MLKSRAGIALLLAAVATGPILWADTSDSGTTGFSQGRSRLSITGGYASTVEKSYLVLGVGAGYYVRDGLEAGLDGEGWFGSRPRRYSISPGVRYILPISDQVRPYAGGFYKRTFYDDLSPLNALGFRAGISTPLSVYSNLSAGIAYEHALGCDGDIYGKCTQVYPEVGLSFSY